MLKFLVIFKYLNYLSYICRVFQDIKCSLADAIFNFWWKFTEVTITTDEHFSVIIHLQTNIIFYILQLNKSNSKAEAVQEEANLQEQLNDHLQSRKLNVANTPVHMLERALTVSEILKFSICLSSKSLSRLLSVNLRMDSSFGRHPNE